MAGTNFSQPCTIFLADICFVPGPPLCWTSNPSPWAKKFVRYNCSEDEAKKKGGWLLLTRIANLLSIFVIVSPLPPSLISSVGFLGVRVRENLLISSSTLPVLGRVSETKQQSHGLSHRRFHLCISTRTFAKMWGHSTYPSPHLT